MGALAELSTLLGLALKDLSASSNARLPVHPEPLTTGIGERLMFERRHVSEQMPPLTAAQVASDEPVQDRLSPGGEYSPIMGIENSLAGFPHPILSPPTRPLLSWRPSTNCTPPARSGSGSAYKATLALNSA